MNTLQVERLSPAPDSQRSLEDQASGAHRENSLLNGPLLGCIFPHLILCSLLVPPEVTYQTNPLNSSRHIAASAQETSRPLLSPTQEPTGLSPGQRSAILDCF